MASISERVSAVASVMVNLQIVQVHCTDVHRAPLHTKHEVQPYVHCSRPMKLPSSPAMEWRSRPDRRHWCQGQRIPIRITRDFEPARCSPSQIHACEMTKAKGIHIIVKAACTHLCGNGDHTHIERVLQTANHVLHAPWLLIPVLNRNAANKNRTRIKISCIWIHCGAIQCGSHGKDLCYRTWFIRLGNGRVEIAGLS
jgi:hypothetical protein